MLASHRSSVLETNTCKPLCPTLETVAAINVLAPGIGEIIGSSQREARLDERDVRQQLPDHIQLLSKVRANHFANLRARVPWPR